MNIYYYQAGKKIEPGSRRYLFSSQLFTVALNVLRKLNKDCVIFNITKD